MRDESVAQHFQSPLSHHQLGKVQHSLEVLRIVEHLVRSVHAMVCRRPKFSDAAIQFCLTIKNLFGLPRRQAMGFVESLLQLSVLHWPVPDFSTVCRRQRSLQVHVPYRSSQAGLHLLVDSTGIKCLGEDEWKCKKHGAERRRQWRKLHIGIDAQTLQIRAICVTGNEVSDAAVIADLLEQVPCNEALLRAANTIQQIEDLRLRRGAKPQAVQAYDKAKQ